jgi:hypothetical protein
MKQHMDKLAPLVDLLTRALDMAGVATEVLGYGTPWWWSGLRRRVRASDPELRCLRGISGRMRRH